MALPPHRTPAGAGQAACLSRPCCLPTDGGAVPSTCVARGRGPGGRRGARLKPWPRRRGLRHAPTLRTLQAAPAAAGHARLGRRPPHPPHSIPRLSLCTPAWAAARAGTASGASAAPGLAAQRARAQWRAPLPWLGPPSTLHRGARLEPWLHCTPSGGPQPPRTDARPHARAPARPRARAPGRGPRRGATANAACGREPPRPLSVMPGSRPRGWIQTAGIRLQWGDGRHLWDRLAWRQGA
jgi:hypothetical protein